MMLSKGNVCLFEISLCLQFLGLIIYIQIYIQYYFLIPGCVKIVYLMSVLQNVTGECTFHDLVEINTKETHDVTLKFVSMIFLFFHRLCNLLRNVS